MLQQLSQQTMMITIGLAILLLVLMQTRHTNRFVDDYGADEKKNSDCKDFLWRLNNKPNTCKYDKITGWYSALAKADKDTQDEQLYDSVGMKCASINGKCAESEEGFTKRDLCKKGHESNDNRLIKDFC